MTGRSRFATSVAVVAIGLSWPLLELLGSAPPFFIVRRTTPAEVVIFGALVAVVGPVAAGLLSSLPGRAGRLMWLLTTALGFIGLAASVNQSLDGNTATWCFAAIVLVGGGITLLERSEHARFAARVLVGAPVALMLIFVFGTPVGSLASEGGATNIARPAGDAEAGPIVLVVFDEFSTASIVDQAGALRSERYPGLARLADLGVWFPNASSVAEFTEQAVPAILTGRAPNPELDPVISDFPRNVFTSAPQGIDIVAHETVTRLCPDETCTAPVTPPSMASRWSLMMADAAVAVAHLNLPPALTADLPDLRTNWMNFGLLAVNGAARTPDRVVDDFLDNGVGAADRDTFLFLHVLLPHRPWVFLPDGTRYGEELSPSARAVDIHSDQRDLTLQRYLIQTQYADALIGELLAGLEAQGLLEDATVVVTADHGVAFDGGDGTRTPTDATVAEVGMVPLFVKSPDVAQGAIDPYFATGFDVTPTILDAMGVPGDADLTGTSLLDEERPPREAVGMLGRHGVHHWTPSIEQTRDHAARIDRLFPTGDLYELKPTGSPPMPNHGDLLEGGRWEHSNVWEVEAADVYGSVSPALIVGEGPVDQAGRWVGVLADAEPLAVARSFVEDGRAVIEAVVSPEILRGQPALEVVVWDGD